MKIIFTHIFICFTLLVRGQVCDPNTNSLFFNGNDSYVEFGSSNDLNITDEITVEAWINATSWGSSYVSNSIVCKHGWTAGERGYVLRAGGNGQLSFAIAGVNTGGNNVSWKEAVSPDNALQLNTWHHVAGTYNGDKIRVYIDGVQVRSVNFKGTIDPSVDYDLKIGRIADDSTLEKRFWHGSIDEVRIWNEARSTNEINNNRNLHIDTSNINNLVGYWRLNDGGGNVIHDMGSGGNSGTLINTIWNTDVPFTNGFLRPEIVQSGNMLVSSSSIGNQWNYNGAPIPGAIGNQIIPLLSGEYSVTVDSGFGCAVTSLTFTFVFTSVAEDNLQSLIKYHLSDGIIYFDEVPALAFLSQMKISDINGRIIFERNSIPEELNMQSLSRGVYILSLQSPSGFLSRKIVLQ